MGIESSNKGVRSKSGGHFKNTYLNYRAAFRKMIALRIVKIEKMAAENQLSFENLNSNSIKNGKKD